MARARLARIDLPDFGMPEERPELPVALYPARLMRLRERADARGYDRALATGMRMAQQVELRHVVASRACPAPACLSRACPAGARPARSRSASGMKRWMR